MREKNRKPIEKVQRLPQFTIMNAIGGQAGIFINSSLIFSSLTTDNILNTITLKDDALALTQQYSGQIVLRYKIGQNGNWQDYTGTFNVSENCVIYPALYNGRDYSQTSVTGEVSNIDKDNPTSVSFTIDEVTEDSIKVTAKASDGAGIKYFDFSSDGGSTYPSANRQTITTPSSGETTKTFTFTGLSDSTSYTIRVKAADEAGNSLESNTQTQETESAVPRVSSYKPASKNATVVPLSTTDVTPVPDNKGNIVKVPKNFGIAYESGDNVAEGIVIEYTGTSDSDPLIGNQYVWVPVGQAITKTDGTTMPAITLGRYTFDVRWNNSNKTFDGTGAPTLIQDSVNWSNPTAVGLTSVSSDSYEFAADDSRGNEYENIKAIDLSGFINSANSNCGYYLARYEAGSGASNGKPYTQKGKKTWTSISQSDASMACQNMYDGVNTDLVNSYTWDSAVVFIQNASGNTGYAKQNRGTYDTGVMNTGSLNDEICKINGMAKNVAEWTTESSNYYDDWNRKDCPWMFRGGERVSQSNSVVSRCVGNNSGTPSIGFRHFLYL